MGTKEYVWIGAMILALLAFYYYYSSMSASMSSAVNGGADEISGNYGD